MDAIELSVEGDVVRAFTIRRSVGVIATRCTDRSVVACGGTRVGDLPHAGNCCCSARGRIKRARSVRAVRVICRCFGHVMTRRAASLRMRADSALDGRDEPALRGVELF